MSRYIDADALRDRFQNLAYDDWNQGAGTTWANAFSEAADIVADAPTADVVKVKHGKWERHYSRPSVFADLYWHCSVCEYKNDNNYANVYHHFCPNCGASMRKETEDE